MITHWQSPNNTFSQRCEEQVGVCCVLNFRGKEGDQSREGGVLHHIFGSWVLHAINIGTNQIYDFVKMRGKKNLLHQILCREFCTLSKAIEERRGVGEVGDRRSVGEVGDKKSCRRGWGQKEL